jgi:hypothetical protein
VAFLAGASTAKGRLEVTPPQLSSEGREIFEDLQEFIEGQLGRNRTAAPGTNMKADGKTFIAGQRFRLSELGAQRCPKFIVKVGKIIRVRENSASVIVQFDGNKTTVTIHRDYIEAT